MNIQFIVFKVQRWLISRLSNIRSAIYNRLYNDFSEDESAAKSAATSQLQKSIFFQAYYFTTYMVQKHM